MTNPYIKDCNLANNMGLNPSTYRLDLRMKGKNLPELIFIKLYERNTLSNGNWILISASEIIDKMNNPSYSWETKIDYIFSVIQNFRVEIHEVSPIDNGDNDREDNNNKNNNLNGNSNSNTNSNSIMTNIVNFKSNLMNNFSTPKQLMNDNTMNKAKKTNSFKGLYNINDLMNTAPNNPTTKLMNYDSRLIGYFDFNLVKIMRSANQTLEILLKKKEPHFSVHDSYMTLNILTRSEGEDQVLLEFSATFNNFSILTPKTYLTIWRAENRSFTRVTQTDPVSSPKPTWPMIKIKLNDLCRCNHELPLRIVIHKVHTIGEDKIIGHVELTMDQIIIKRQLEFDIIKFSMEVDKGQSQLTQTIFGRMSVISFNLIRNPSFVDYIFNGVNIESSIYIDFSSNNKPTNDIESLHYIDDDSSNDPLNENNNIARSKYEEIFSIFPQILRQYNKLKNIEMYGFGFGFDSVENGNLSNTTCLKISDHVDNFNEDYRNILKTIQLGGQPLNIDLTLINAKIKLDESVKNNTKLFYHIQFIMLSTVPCDLECMKDTIIKICSDYPFIIIFVGIGNGPWDTMYEFCNNVYENIQSKSGKSSTEPVTNIISFIEYNKYNRPELIANRVLCDIPKRMTEYYLSKGIYPSNA